ncbi:PREDICTED: zona pellucida sperm-binding protein 4-like [Poecilia mexicana]|nr:PREDICTED: zona pellucida sperm-binding protein 4-like [Poecilia mexicana]
MAAFLPYADPESIHVRDPFMSWQSLSSVSPFCGYMLQATAGHGLILHSPLPACHSQLQTPTTISLPISYWDFFTWQNRTLDLQCPYQSPLDPPEETPWTFPTAPSATEDESGPSIATKTEVFCSFQQMKIVLPPGPISEIVLKDTNGNQMSLAEAPKECGYYASEAKDGKIHLFLQLHSHCHMSVQGKMYIISILYTTQRGKKEAKVSCPLVIPRSEHECNLHSEYRLPCGSSSISETQCLSMGCCFNKHPPACYYPMDECTIDRHMIFSVPASLTDPPLSTALLAAASNSTCRPQRVTPEYALFKIPMDGCGTRRVVVGKTVVYMVEITNTIQTVSLNYGTITRDSPVRLLVECRYVPGTVLGVSYVVKTPTLGPDVHTQGVFGVQLRIAKDAQYTSYYPQYHQPLHMLLGKPLHLEVRLLSSPDPSLVLLVHFCVAYPRSGNAAWVLLYNGCPNPLDPAPPETVLSDPTPPSPQSQTRRFTIRTFQFLPDGEFQDMDEEIYFMCSTEICSPRDGPCVEGCFGQ